MTSEQRRGGEGVTGGYDDVLQNIVTSGDLIKIVLFFSNLFIVFHKAVTEITRRNIFNNRNILDECYIQENQNIRGKPRAIPI